MKKIFSVFKRYQKHFNFLFKITMLFLCLRAFYLIINTIFLASITNAISSLKTISLTDIRNGFIVTCLLSVIVCAVNSSINQLLERPNQSLRNSSITFLVMVFLLISLSIEQFNIITGILATSILIQNNFTNNLTSKVLSEPNTKPKKYILKRTKRENNHHYNRKFPKRIYNTKKIIYNRKNFTISFKSSLNSTIGTVTIR